MNYDIDPIIQDRLHNWSNYVTFASAHGGHCLSLEHRYVQEGDLENDNKRKPHIIVDVPDAIKIEKALTNPDFPKKKRKLIVQTFAYHKYYKDICRELGIRFSEYAEQLMLATNMVKNNAKN